MGAAEQHIKGIGVLLLDDLSYYKTLAEKQQRLVQLEKHFPVPLSLVQSDKLDYLDIHQRTLNWFEPMMQHIEKETK